MSNSTLESISTHAISCPMGFVAGGTACGIKASGADDLAMIIAPRGAAVSGVFTRNLVKAAPVVLSQKNIAQSAGRMRALVINSGCANAATGEAGHSAALAVMNETASLLNCDPSEVLMNSTGVIGEPLDDRLIIDALPSLIQCCTADHLGRAAIAIHTTDTRIKTSSRNIAGSKGMCRVVGIAKGAGMIHPNMATTIGVIMTDARADHDALDRMLREAVEHSFHRITVDGDTSTNDSVFLMASGEAGTVAEPILQQAISEVARDLAEQVVRDGEGARKLIRVRVINASSADDALVVARTVASSLLVRTSVAGGDPNWGRILAAAGRSGVDFDPGAIALRANELPLFSKGQPTHTPRNQLEAAYQSESITLEIDLNQGSARDEFLTCDLTEGYISINADYTS